MGDSTISVPLNQMAQLSVIALFIGLQKRVLMKSMGLFVLSGQV